MSQQQLLLKEKLSISQSLLAHGKQFTQITGRYSDGRNGRCSNGVIMSYYGWNGEDDSHIATKLVGALIALRYAGIDKNLIIQLNDSDATFDEIAVT
ncbi:MAG: hypothetical protein WBV84_04285 [Nitrososphaeraceae archaeon]